MLSIPDADGGKKMRAEELREDHIETVASASRFVACFTTVYKVCAGSDRSPTQASLSRPVRGAGAQPQRTENRPQLDSLVQNVKRKTQRTPLQYYVLRFTLYDSVQLDLMPGLLENLTGDHMALDLVGALEDAGHTRVAIHAFKWQLAREAHAAVDLDRLVDHLRGHLGAIELDYARLECRALAAVDLLRAVIYNLLHRIDFHRHVGQLKLNRLEIGDRAAELLAFDRILERQLIGLLGRAEARRAQSAAPDILRLHRDRKAAADRAEHICGGHAAVLEI